MNLPSFLTHTYLAHMLSLWHSHRGYIGITEVGSDSKVIEWCTLVVCSACAQHVRSRKWQILVSSSISCSVCVLF